MLCWNWTLWCYKIWNKLGGCGRPLSCSLVGLLSLRQNRSKLLKSVQHLPWLDLCSLQTDIHRFPFLLYCKRTHTHAHTFLWLYLFSFTLVHLVQVSHYLTNKFPEQLLLDIELILLSLLFCFFWILLAFNLFQVVTSALFASHWKRPPFYCPPQALNLT